MGDRYKFVDAWTRLSKWCAVSEGVHQAGHRWRGRVRGWRRHRGHLHLQERRRGQEGCRYGHLQGPGGGALRRAVSFLGVSVMMCPGILLVSRHSAWRDEALALLYLCLSS